MTHLPARSRILVAIAAVLLCGLYLVPLWRIHLHAPQYPEGIGLLIRVNTISGMKQEDLHNINGLNHYIGMKVIDPTSIPVLTAMPWVVGGLAVLALATAAIGLRVVLFGWLATFAAAGLAGLAEFYLWSYDYGHNLSPDAVIKVPGMSYQPPVIGTKQLLNFTASSWPDVGSYLAAAAFLLGVGALFLVRRSAPHATRVAAPSQVVGALAVLLVALTVGCAPSGPRPIAYGSADCDVCRMRITDNRFGGEVVTAKGKVMQFDSIECLANYVATVDMTGGEAFVSDFQHPGTLIPARTARYQRRAGPSADMGADLIALSPASTTGGSTLTWAELRAVAARHELRAADPTHGYTGA
jgi:hypothetical protein